MAADIVYLRGERVRSVQGGADLVSGTVYTVLTAPSERLMLPDALTV